MTNLQLISNSSTHRELNDITEAARTAFKNGKMPKSEVQTILKAAWSMRDNISS